MRIFQRTYALRLYRTNKLEKILEILEPWIDDVLYMGSPFLRQVASYHLRVAGSSYAPRLFKTVLASEIIRLNEMDDLKASLRLAIIIAFRMYDLSKGNVSLVTWLAWKIPYELSKLVTWRIFHPVEPYSEDYLPFMRCKFERTFEKKRQTAILAADLKLDKRSKYYYLKKVEGKYETFS